jgi:hypothetical protein
MATGRQVPYSEPKATVPEAIRAIAEAYQHVFDRWPNQAELVTLAAMSSHETAEWTKMAGYNLAGLKASVSGTHDYYNAKTFEYEPQPDGTKKKVVMYLHFRSYATLQGGAVDFLDLLRRGYPKALAAAREGDIDAFVDGLTKGWGGKLSWFTAPKSQYLAAVKVRAQQISSWPIDYTQITEPYHVGEEQKDG